MLSINNSDDLDDGVSSVEERALPAEVWASVMQYLPFESILSCAATSRMILRNAIPLLKTLHIDKPAQMNLVLAYRFRDVTEININCLLKVEIVQEPGEPDWPTADMDFESRMRVVPFISKFHKLERVIFRGRGEDGQVLKRFAIANAYFFDDDLDTPSDRMIALIDSISGAFRCVALQKKLKVLGLCCPRVTLVHPSSCETCLRACKSFPLESVLHFESSQSSTSHAYSGRLHELDVCLQISEIESVIESRPGGHELLRSDERLLRLLGSGKHNEITAADGEILHIVVYSDEQLAEIKRVIDYADLNVKEITSIKITAAILRSFTLYNCTLLPPPTRRYLSPLSIEHLTSKIGLLINAKDFEAPPAKIIEQFLPKIGLILEDEDNSDEFTHIQPHCLRLISDFLEVSVSATICQQIDDLIPCLVQCLRGNQTDTGDLRHYSVRSLMNIIVKGTPEQEQIVVNEGGIPPLIQCLSSSKDFVVIAAVQALGKLATGRSTKHLEKVITARTIPPFIELLDSNHDICVETSLNLLVNSAKSHVIGMCDKSLIPRLTRIMKSASRLHMLPVCSTLLVNTIDFGQPVIQDVIDEDLLPTVIDIMITNDDPTVQSNLAHALIKLATSDQTGVIAKVEGLLSVLITLLDSSIDVITNESIIALGNIVQIAPEYCQLVVKAEVMKPLLHIINHSDKIVVLKNATETFSQCCRGKSTNLTATKAALNVLTRLLVHVDIDVLRHTCWALFHLLDGLEYEDVCSVMKTQYFLNHVIHLLKRALSELEQPILKSLYLITKVGCADLIARCEGIAAISKTLSSSNEENQNLACCTIGKLICGSSDRFQALIDSNTVSSLFKIMTQKHNDKFALCVIYEAVESATPLQIQYLLAHDCIKHLCAFLTTNVKFITGSICNTEIAALRTLKNILAVTYQLLLHVQIEAKLNKKTLEMIKSTLGKLTDESIQRVHEAIIVKLLEKKKAWLEVDACDKRVESLNNAVAILKDQLQQAEQQLHLLLEKSVEVGKTSFAGKVCNKFIERHNESITFIRSQLTEVNAEVCEELRSFSRLSTEAEEIAPKAEWYARLAKNDLAADLDGVIKALHVSTSNLKSLADIRVSSQTTFSICEMKKGFELLYRNLDAHSGRKNGCDNNSLHNSDSQIVIPMPMKRYISDFFESATKRKKQESNHDKFSVHYSISNAITRT